MTAPDITSSLSEADLFIRKQHKKQDYFGYHKISELRGIYVRRWLCRNAGNPQQ